MFARFRLTRSRFQVSLVETRRTDGRLKHEHVASLASVGVPASTADCITFRRNPSRILSAGFLSAGILCVTASAHAGDICEPSFDGLHFQPECFHDGCDPGAPGVLGFYHVGPDTKPFRGYVVVKA